MSKEDLELEELEKQFLEDLNSKPKPKKTTVIDVNKFNQEFDKDFEELNKREGKINNSFEKNNVDKKMPTAYKNTFDQPTYLRVCRYNHRRLSKQFNH